MQLLYTFVSHLTPLLSSKAHGCPLTPKMRHSTTLWAAVGVLSVVAAEAEFGAIPFEDVPQLDEHGFDKRQCCCQQTSTVTATVTETPDCGYIP